ncbi:MAG: HepT-like ribonuclease domain-containing protein [Tepidisphaeraceae bacterium]
MRNLQVMAESTQRLSDTIKASEPAIPWFQIEGFRHRLVHDYFRIDEN